METFYRRDFDAMFRYARRLTGRDESFCLDIVQDATLKIVRSVRPMPAWRDFARWQRRVVRSVAIDLLRRESTRSKHEGGAFEAGPDPGPAERADLAERIEQLDRRLRSLSASERALVRGRFFEGLGLAELGRRVGLGAGAVHGRLGRLLKRLGQREAGDTSTEHDHA